MARIVVDWPHLEVRAVYDAPPTEEGDPATWVVEYVGEEEPPVDLIGVLRRDLRRVYGVDFDDAGIGHSADPFTARKRLIERDWPDADVTIEFGAEEEVPEDEPDWDF